MVVLSLVVACACLWYVRRNSQSDGQPPSSDIASATKAATGTNPDRQNAARVALAGIETGVEKTNEGATAQSGTTDRQSALAQIRSLVRDEPKLAEQIALEERERFPDGPDADERDALLVAEIFNQHDIARARVEARRYYRKHPGGRYTDYLIRETGVRPPPPPILPSN